MLRCLLPPARASLICAAVMLGYSDHNSAAAPVTNGQAALVPEKRAGAPSELTLSKSWPGAASPRWPIEALKLQSLAARPARSIETTGITHGCLVMHEPPTLA